MTAVKAVLLASCVLAGAAAQTFPQEYRTDDATVASRIRYFCERMSDEHNSLSGEFQRLIALPANRFYRQLDAQARTVALQSALPLVKQMAMSGALQKAHDEQIAQQFGAVDHGLKLPYRADPGKRFEEMSRQLQKNRGLMANPGFMKELVKTQQEVVQKSAEEAFDRHLRLFTLPLADVRRDFQNDRKASGRNGDAEKCYSEAATLVDSDPDRFRLLAFRCALLKYGVDKSEAEADRFRKERAQRLYDEKSIKGAIRKALIEFLQTASTVDFAAETVPKGSRQVFVNPEYENKDSLWKLIYRNGKEPTAVTVEFAKAWLAELQPASLAPAPTPVKPADRAKAAPVKASTTKTKK